jgi:oxygen-dependent protoporphyrinogen oxidase
LNRYDLVVVGGGIAGLAAAWEATERRPGGRIAVLEAGARFGGKLLTGELLDHPVDRGADAFLIRTPDALDLCGELGLSDELVHPAERRAFLWTDGALRTFPEGLVLGVPTDLETLVSSGIVSAAGVERAAEDLEQPGEPLEGDTTVGALVRARLGDEVFEKLVDPLLSGINAGDADELSLEAGAPQLAAAARYGSLIRGARAQRASGDPDAPVFASLRRGTERLVERLLEALRERGVELRDHTAVRAITRETEGVRWLAEAVNGESFATDSVVLASPTMTGHRGVEGPVAEIVESIAVDYASVSVVTLAFRRDAIEHPLDASGVLVPAREGRLMTACSFGSSKWPDWSDDDVALFRVSTGRAHDSRHLQHEDRDLVAVLTDELDEMLGIHGRALASTVTRWPDALPQYRPGHLDRLDAAEAALAERLPGLALAGAGTRGIGIPACIRSGRMATLRALEG